MYYKFVYNIVKNIIKNLNKIFRKNIKFIILILHNTFYKFFFLIKIYKIYQKI